VNALPNYSSSGRRNPRSSSGVIVVIPFRLPHRTFADRRGNRPCSGQLVHQAAALDLMRRAVEAGEAELDELRRRTT
jgi:hypothetical protein